jgi:chromosome segregation ATPase
LQIRSKFAELKARVVHNDVEIVANFFADFTINESIMRVCQLEQDKANAASKAYEVPPVEEFDDYAFCEFVTANILSQSTKNVVNKTVDRLNTRVKETTEENKALRQQLEELKEAESSQRDELRACMDELSTALNDIDALKISSEQALSLHTELVSTKSELESLKNCNARATAALTVSQQDLASAEEAVANAKREIADLSNDLAVARSSEKEFAATVKQLRDREASLARDLEDIQSQKEAEKNSFDEAAMCESVVSDVMKESTRRALNAHTNILNKKLLESQNIVLQLESENVALKNRVAEGPSFDESKSANVISADRETDLLKQVADLKEQLNECESDLVAAKDQLAQQSTPSGVISADRETDLLKQVADLKEQLNECESDLVAAKDQLTQQSTPSGVISADRETDLLKQVADLKEQLNECESDLVATKDQLAQQSTPSGVISADRETDLLKQVADLKEQLNECESDLVAAKESIATSTTKQEAAASQLAEREAELADLKTVLQEKEQELHAIASDGMAQLELSQQQEKSVIQLQALARGYNARASTKRLKIHQAAKVSGVLVALKHTVQGTQAFEVHFSTVSYLCVQASQDGIADPMVHCTTLCWTRQAFVLIFASNVTLFLLRVSGC